MAETPTATPTRGYKPMAWEGVGLFVPQRWELGRRNGSYRQGWFRVDDEQRMAIQIRWWTSKRLVSMDEIVAQHIRDVHKGDSDTRPEPRPLADLALPDKDDERAAAFVIEGDTDDEPETLIIWQRPKIRRIAVFRLLRTPGSVTEQMLAAMLPGLLLQTLDDWRLWAVHDFALQSPPGFKLATAGLAAGICYLRFKHKRSSIALRRFSAADAVLNREDPDLVALRSWCQVLYASEFYDMRYEITEDRDPRDRPMLRLNSRPKFLAPIELAWLIPKHRQLPHRIDIIWDPNANKIYCVEIRRPKRFPEGQIAAFEERLQMTLDHVALPTLTYTEEEAEASVQQRQRSLCARVAISDTASHSVDDVGLVHVTYRYQRTQGLRLLRSLGGAKAGPEEQKRELELDMVGSEIWRECDDQQRVCDLVAMVERRFKISYREAEQSVVAWVQDLGNRGLLTLYMDE